MAERRKPPAGRARPVLAGAVVLATALVCGDAAPARAYRSIGSGTESCGSWTASRREVDPGRSVTPGSQAALQEMQWVLGFLAGVGYGSVDLDPLNNVDAQGVWAWVDNYCQAHALEKIREAAQAFVNAHPH
jgi:hypothetical protein